MIGYYDRDGIPMSMGEWAERHDDLEYKRVALTRVMDGADPDDVREVSTVWLGLDHSFTGDGPPIIFETMVFAEKASVDLDCVRYATLAQARAGHVEMVVLVAAEMTDPIDMNDVAPSDGTPSDG